MLARRLAGFLFLLVAVPPAHGQGCSECTPLDASAGPAYLGQYALGLYPGGSNTPPAAHRARALEAAAQVVPRGASGAADANGVIGFISIGMSNTNQEFAAFERQEDVRLGRNARVLLVDCAVGGQSAEVIVNRSAPYWTTVDQRVVAAGLDPRQVQVAWLKEADGSVPTTSFPAHAETLETHVRGIVRHLKDRFVNLQLCYVASRTYGGYTTNPQRGEPLSYETGFAFRWLIESQIAGDARVNPDPSAGAVEAPVLLWGAYLWANGSVPRPSDGLVWLPVDFESDHVHPSAAGEAKVAALLGGFFTADPTATPWYLGGSGTALQSLGAIGDAYVDDAQPAQNFGSAAVLAFAYPGVRSYLLFDLGAVGGSVVHAKLSLKTPPEVPTRGAEVVVVSDTGWNELALTAANAPPFDGAMLGTIPQASRGTAVSLDVTVAVGAALGAAASPVRLALGLRATPGPSTPQQVGSRESVDPPRLVLTTLAPATAVGRPHADPEAEPASLRLVVAPNPVNEAATVALVLSRDTAAARVTILDPRGRRVRALLSGRAAAGRQDLAWDGRDDAGRPVANGVYWVHAIADDSMQHAVRKLVIAH